MKLATILAALCLATPVLAQSSTPAFDSMAADEGFRSKCMMKGQPQAVCGCFIQVVNGAMRDALEKTTIYLYILGEYDQARAIRAKLRDQPGYTQRQQTVDNTAKPCQTLIQR